MISFLRRIVHIIEETPFSLPLWFGSFLALILMRLTVENVLGHFHPQSLIFFFFEFAHTFLFFSVSFFILLPVIRFAGAASIQKATHLLLFGFLVILSPPIIDTLVFRGEAFWSFYEFDGIHGLIIRFFTLFGDTPNIGITYGVRVEVVMVTVGIGLYAFLKSKKFSRALLSALLTYSILFVLGTFPSFLTLITEGYSKGFFAIGSLDIAGMFLTPTELFSRDIPDMRSALNTKMSLWYGCILIALITQFVFIHFRHIFSTLLKNARVPQLIYHGGLLLLGMLLAAHFTNTSIQFDSFHILGVLLLIASVECAWLASVVANDSFDTQIDSMTNPDRPLITGTIDRNMYMTIGWLFFFGSLFFAAIVSFSASLILLAYQAIAWAYSAPPYRLKRFPGIATLLASAAGTLILLLGYIVIAPKGDFSTLPFALLAFLFISYAAALPLKDFKDIRGDHADGVWTFPILLGEESARIVFGSIFFLLFVSSVFVFRLHSAFLPALFFGGCGFFLMQTARQQHPWASYRHLPLLLLGLIAGYGFILLWLIR